MANKHTTATGHPNHRAQEAESILIQQKHLICLNNYLHQDKAGQSGSIFNPNPVSTGLKLSFEEEEHNSSVTSASENLKAVLPVISSVSDNLKIEIDRQQEEFDHFIKVQVINMMLQTNLWCRFNVGHSANAFRIILRWKKCLIPRNSLPYHVLTYVTVSLSIYFSIRVVPAHKVNQLLKCPWIFLTMLGLGF